MVALSPLAGAGWQFFTSNGVPLAGGKLFTYSAGTTTPRATFTSSSGATPHANPIILDSAGRVPSEVWLTASAAYKFTLKTAVDVEIWTKDDIFGIAAAADLDGYVTKAELASTASGEGGDLVGLTDGGTVQDFVDYQPFAIREGSVLTPNGADWTSTINAALAANLRVNVPQLRGSGTGARYGISGNGIRIVQNGTWLSFDADARLVPFNSTAPTYCIRAEGEAPTLWFALSANTIEGTITFQLASLPSGWAVGDWVEMRDDTVITGCPNARNAKQACLRQIEAISGTGPVTFTVHKPLPYSFTTAANASAGKPTMIENIIIERPTLNDEEFGNNLIQFPIFLKYVANAKIIAPVAFGSKQPYAPDIVAGDYIKLNNCIDIDIYDPRMTHGGYYGVSIINMTEDVRIDQGVMTDVRHGVSVVWGATGDYGQPINIATYGMRSVATALSGYDTHDTGREITFSYCMSEGAGDDGFQIRTTNVILDHCEALGAAIDGFSQETGATGIEAIGCVARDNGRFGVNWRYDGGVWIGGRIINSGTANNRSGVIPTSGGPGMWTAGGYVGSGTRFSQNTECIRVTTGNDMLIDGVIAPADAKQTYFLRANTGLNLGNVRVQNSRISGYANQLWSSISGLQSVSPQSSGNATTETAADRQGYATLVAGSVTIANTAFRNYAGGSGGLEPQRSKITLTRTTNGGTLGALYVQPGADGVGFDIKSTSALDTSIVRWEMSQ
jgi:hypothetical protein